MKVKKKLRWNNHLISLKDTNTDFKGNERNIMKNLFYRLSLLSISLLLSVSYGHAEEPAPTDLNEILKNVPAKCQTSHPDFKTQLYCSQTYFHIYGKPIDPMIIKDLIPSTLFKEDGVVSINLLNSQNARYFNQDKDLKIEQEGEYFSVEVTYPQEEEVTSSEESEMTSPEESDSPERFSYKILGKTTKGIFVLRVIEEQEGLIVASCLLFVRIREDKGFDYATYLFDRERILIETLGLFPLEDRSARTRVDRASSSVTMDGNTLTIEKQFVEEITLE